MANLKLKNPSGGSLNLVSADGASDLTLTFPATTGTAMVSGNMPAFSAWKSGSSQSISQTTWVKITYDTEDFDTNNNFASSTFTPTIAGYYVLTLNTECSSFTGSLQAMFYKNGTYYARAGISQVTGQPGMNAGSVVLYMNGSTDYAEVYVYCSASGVSLSAGDIFANRFTGAMVRSA